MKSFHLRFHCLSCDEESGTASGLCQVCARKLQDISFPRYCYGPESQNFISAIYESPISDLIKRAKEQEFSFWDERLKRFFSNWISHWCEVLARLPFDALVSVPGHPLRIHLETDLAAFVALEISKKLKKRVVTDALIRRTLAAREFFFLNKNPSLVERLHWRPFSFEVPRKPSICEGLRILLIDDVMTTGATLRRCRQLLESQGLKVAGSFVLSSSQSQRSSNRELDFRAPGLVDS
jgi:predicted amidophosphoribosyltransferase